MVAPERIRYQGRLPLFNLEMHPRHKQRQGQQAEAQKDDTASFSNTVDISTYDTIIWISLIIIVKDGSGLRQEIAQQGHES